MTDLDLWREPSLDAERGALQFIELQVRTRNFAMPIDRVVEFRTWIEPTPLPNAPPHMLGIVNIRGEIVPVFDVGALLGFGLTQAGVWHVIILALTSNGQVVGLLVDDVSDIVDCAAGGVVELPPAADDMDDPVIRGAVEISGAVTGVLDLDRLCEAERVIERPRLPAPVGRA